MSQKPPNPALQMLGISRLRIPSPKWMAVWCVLGGLVGGVVYDKQQQRSLRAKYMESVRPLGAQTFHEDLLPRKIRVYAAPPPNDFLNETLKYFRRFVKPIVNAAGIDFELVTENRQGVIRNAVAEEIRRLRRERAGLPEPEKEPKEETKEKEEDKKPQLGFNPTFQMAMAQNPPKVEEEEDLKPLSELYHPSDVLGLTKYLKDSPPITVKREDQDLSVQESGGVICIGRGAYKEYLTGVHEGLLGPLYDPHREEVAEAKRKLKEAEQKEMAEMTDRQRKRKEYEIREREEEESDRPPDAFISPAEYAGSEVAPELQLAANPRDTKGNPYFFLQPILLLRIYNVAGFTKQPERIRRFYNKRVQQQDYADRVYGLVTKKSRPFRMGDRFWDAEEEQDWPKAWVKRGTEKHSEWCKEFALDERVVDLLSVYEPESLDVSHVEVSKKVKVVKERKPWI